jgi:hypothetical protein
MKPTLKLTTVLLCLQLFAITVLAQATKNKFTGIWELRQDGYNEQPLQNAPSGLLKIFNADNTFSNVRLQRTQSIISHSGKYQIEDAKQYSETAFYRIPQMDGLTPLGTALKINYLFSEDEHLLTLTFTAETGIRVTEVWRKL